MTWWFVGATVVSTAVTMYSQYQQGQAQQREYAAQELMYQAQADQAQEESRVAKLQAMNQSEMAQDQAKGEDKKLKRQQLKLIGKQRATLAAMGISGVTAEDIMSDTLQVQDMDTSTLHWNADIASWEAETNGSYNEWALQNEAAMHRASKLNTASAGKSAARMTNINMTGTLIKGAVSIAGGVASRGATSGMKAPSGSNSAYLKNLTGRTDAIKKIATPRSSLPY